MEPLSQRVAASLLSVVENPQFNSCRPRDKQLSTNATKKPSYAEVAKLKNRKKKPTMLLYPTEENDKTIESILREELKEDGPNFKIRVVRKLQNKGLAIVCDKEQEFDQLKRTIESNDSLKKNITVRLPGKRLPSLIIYDLPNDTTNKDVQTALKAYTNMQEDLRLRFKMKGRREGTSHWVLETPGEVLHTLKQLKKIPINCSMYQMKEFFHVKRCSTCQAYGHTENAKNLSKECKFTTPFCGCCGYRHHSRSCRSEDSNCINCSESNRLRASTQDPLKILQINLARAKASTNQLHLTESTIKSDIILVQEQYHYNKEIPGIPKSWETFSSTNQKSAILIPSAQIKPALLETKVNVVAVKIQTSSYPITIISAYSSPAQDVSKTLQEIQEIITSLPEEKIIIGADLNRHNTIWVYRSNDNRGNEVLDFILANNLYILNKSDAPPTFQRNNSIGWPDLTLCSQSIIDYSINWEVLEDISLSDHRYIQTTIASTIANQFYKRYKTRHGNHPRYLNILGKDIYYLENKIATARNSRELNDATIVLQNSIINVCNKTFKIKKQLLLTKPNWWTEKLEIHKKKYRFIGDDTNTIAFHRICGKS
ncbi:putative 115 kDa protein in type-1 like protein [Argiope bruennichi]|uniref:Putative 115 kDa protein in type-1 like protein n=1 Tax=Argiope bruennichi TaxID=94029 RepID=A0A8T0FN11_ARGBR|nr:putative 115 kDa protein in type-1 like protein [Argiope bruennichi]